MIFSELYKIMVNKFTFVGSREGDRPPSWGLISQALRL